MLYAFLVRSVPLSSQSNPQPYFLSFSIPFFYETATTITSSPARISTTITTATLLPAAAEVTWAATT